VSPVPLKGIRRLPHAPHGPDAFVRDSALRPDLERHDLILGGQRFTFRLVPCHLRNVKPLERATRPSHLWRISDAASLNPEAMWVYDTHTLDYLDVNEAAIGRQG
jgi:hypothetical protein